MATALSLAPCRDGRRLMNAAIPIDGTEEIYIKDLLQLTISCCLDDEGPEYRRALVNNITNIPRHYRFCCHDNDTNEWSLTLDGHRCKDDKENNQPASFYRNGGRKENKIAPEEKFTVQEGDVLIFRPPLQHRKGKWMRNLEYRVVAADVDADADDGVGEEEAGVVVVADAADDVVEEEEEEELEVEEAEVVVDANADDGDEEAVEEEGEQSILPGKEEEVVFIVVEEEEEIEEVTVKTQSMLIQERQDRAEKSGQVVSLLDTPEKTNVVVVPSFEEIRSIMGFSPLNNTSDPVPHDEDLLSWSLKTPSPRPSRRSIYDPIRIN